MVFGFSQVMIDLEPLYYILTDNPPLHRFLHSYAGAILIALPAWWLGKPVCSYALTLWDRCLSVSQQKWCYVPPQITHRQAAVGAFVGTISHVALDSIMHLDIQPLQPLLQDNILLGILSIDDLHIACGIAGLAGLVLLGFVYIRKLRSI